MSCVTRVFLVYDSQIYLQLQTLPDISPGATENHEACDYSSRLLKGEVVRRLLLAIWRSQILGSQNILSQGTEKETRIVMGQSVTFRCLKFIES